MEGFFDATKISQAGYPFVVALMSCTMSEEQARLPVAHADMVLLMFHEDEAGRAATDEGLLKLGRKIWTKAVIVPEGKQTDQLTSEELKQLLERK